MLKPYAKEYNKPHRYKGIVSEGGYYISVTQGAESVSSAAAGAEYAREHSDRTGHHIHSRITLVHWEKKCPQNKQRRNEYYNK